MYVVPVWAQNSKYEYLGIYFWKRGVEGQAGMRVEKLSKETAGSKAGHKKFMKEGLLASET